MIANDELKQQLEGLGITVTQLVLSDDDSALVVHVPDVFTAESLNNIGDGLKRFLDEIGYEHKAMLLYGPITLSTNDS